MAIKRIKPSDLTIR